MTIGKLSKASGISVDTIRYYEKLGLINKPNRANDGYRIYSDNALNTLNFIKRAKLLDFTLNEIKKLIYIINDDAGDCGQILSIIEEKIIIAQSRVEQLKLVSNELQALANNCPGGKVTTDNCPLVNHLQY